MKVNLEVLCMFLGLTIICLAFYYAASPRGHKKDIFISLMTSSVLYILTILLWMGVEAM